MVSSKSSSRTMRLNTLSPSVPEAENEVYLVLFRSDFVDRIDRNNGRVKTIYNDDLKVVTIICDLIVHSRGEIVEKDNLIALEMKKSYRPMKEKENDKARLVALTKDSYDGVWSFDGKTLPEHVCGYDLGIYYEIDSKNCLVYIEYYVKGKKVRTYEEKILR